MWANGKPRGAMQRFVCEKVKESKWTKEEIIKATYAEFPDCRPQVPEQYLRHGMYGKEKDALRFRYKIVEDPNGIIRFDLNQPTGRTGW
jgi:hypothetical protein